MFARYFGLHHKPSTGAIKEKMKIKLAIALLKLRKPIFLTLDNRHKPSPV